MRGLALGSIEVECFWAWGDYFCAALRDEGGGGKRASGIPPCSASDGRAASGVSMAGQSSSSSSSSSSTSMSWALLQRWVSAQLQLPTIAKIGQVKSMKRTVKSFLGALQSPRAASSDFPPLPPGHTALRTLVVDLEDTLVHLEWDRKFGWRTARGLA